MSMTAAPRWDPTRGQHRRADRPRAFLRLGFTDRPENAVRSLLGEATSIRVKPRADVELVRWGLRFLRECTPSRSRANTLAKLELASYSQRLMDELSHRESLQYCQTSGGVLYLYRDEAELSAAERNSSLLQEHGRQQNVLDAEQITEVEPALKRSTYGSRARFMTRRTRPATLNDSRSGSRRSVAGSESSSTCRRLSPP